MGPQNLTSSAAISRGVHRRRQRRAEAPYFNVCVATVDRGWRTPQFGAGTETLVPAEGFHPRGRARRPERLPVLSLGHFWALRIQGRGSRGLGGMVATNAEVDLEKVVLPPGEDFGIPSDYEVDEEQIELSRGFETCIGEAESALPGVPDMRGRGRSNGMMDLMPFVLGDTPVRAPGEALRLGCAAPGPCRDEACLCADHVQRVARVGRSGWRKPPHRSPALLHWGRRPTIPTAALHARGPRPSICEMSATSRHSAPTPPGSQWWTGCRWCPRRRRKSFWASCARCLGRSGTCGTARRTCRCRRTAPRRWASASSSTTAPGWPSARSTTSTALASTRSTSSASTHSTTSSGSRR